eukprot:Gregarina_sp_Pseudo_9__5821@NODE_888_length_2094_cov_158_817032_g834_i0_p1_GENE_NODE_888_length_2094_cov_158_817032_g834_i0NODE_888_length_2094_cov_158_817032_g834_i0_p1_ORF_typecomplete_len617_score112_54Lipase_3/PF01764_25/1_6e20DUF2974/PF11187_8/1_3e06Abhydrolase_3/PF07859_13/2_3e03Abhydrolase_3/PF07859_13/0_0055DUF676/PF05057_14/0_0026Esterase/PF00756_20/0_0098Chlorophyllase2/PF12740_7/0_058Esterase_phd/PF10503_9/0_054Chlorophyllase/PF07224_11/0_11Chlorophyllase/PF07224_11/3e03DUF2048/PF0975
MMKLLVKVCWLISCRAQAEVLFKNVVPRTLFESDPPNHLCTYGFIGGLEKTMNAAEGSAATIFSQIRLQNVFRWLGLTPGHVTLERPDTDALAHGAVLDASSLPPRARINSGTKLDKLAGLEDMQESIVSLRDVIRSDQFTLAGQAAGDQGLAAINQNMLGVSPTLPWKNLVNSYFIEALMKGCVGSVTPEGLGFKLNSPMMNLGDVICQAVEWAKKGDPDWHTYTCSAITAVGEAVGCANSPGPNCAVEVAAAAVPREEPVCGSHEEGALQIQFGAFEAGATISDEEGFMTYHVMRAIWQFQQFASRGGLCGIQFPTTDVIPGWHSVLEVSVAEPGVRALRETNSTVIKTALVLSKSEDEYLVIVRGTSNDYEWNKNFRTQLTPLDNGYGHVHSGIFELAQAVLPEVLGLVRHRAAQSTDKIRVTVAGHSLGGGIANVLGLLLVEESEKRMSGQLEVQVLGLAAPRSLDRTATAMLQRGAQVRNWLSELDVVPQLPCATSFGFPRCDSRTAFGSHGEGADFYVDQLNSVMIRTKELTKLNANFGTDSWGSIKIEYDLKGGLRLNTSGLQIPAPLQMSAYHICAYACYLSVTYCLSPAQRLTDPGWMCNECPWIEV